MESPKRGCDLGPCVVKRRIAIVSLRFKSASPRVSQKGVHTHPLTAREREHWFLQHVSHFMAVNFGGR